ncbi:exodeoxyribonuclease I [Candidatus Pantoea edessiphila]|uniref:Exodeoxyribonuclease I n=1 Tax=Candidatus Pantoea edessiphila TaxID=2044610 RepID=A0A2P5SWQ3_9GAMM|nr:exodeoxyribonuclease I [Candidatus Pantoea edessiphila]PPI86746.1 exodeoxyribonuclease I [Candidatus Pantoea edessiphila]
MNCYSTKFFFHDYETFGTNPALDRPAQFAGVFTDDKFNITTRPKIFYCCLPNDYLPKPESVVVNGIIPQLVMQKGYNEAEFAKRIHNILTIKQTCTVGYNNIQFDDEITRNIFYRNFYDPYAWSWKNGNSRWDLLNVMRACYALRPEGINWPRNKDGFVSFKLKHLTKANGIKHDNIHNAMSDVYATIAIAKLVKEKQPKLFEYLFKNRNKEKIISMIDIVGMKPLLHVSNLFGKSRNNISLILPLAWHPNNRNTLIVIDLSSDIYPLLRRDVFFLQKFLYEKKYNKEIADKIPLILVHINRCPILASINVLRPEDEIRLGLDRAHCINNLKLIYNNPEIRKKVLIIFNMQKQNITSDVDTKLYDGFFSSSDQAKMNIIHRTSPKLLSKLNLNFENNRLKELLFRYRARNYPNTLSFEEQLCWKKHCKINLNYKRIKSFLSEIKLLKKSYKDNQNKIEILRSLYFYAKSIIT